MKGMNSGSCSKSDSGRSGSQHGQGPSSMRFFRCVSHGAGADSGSSSGSYAIHSFDKRIISRYSRSCSLISPGSGPFRTTRATCEGAEPPPRRESGRRLRTGPTRRGAGAAPAEGPTLPARRPTRDATALAVVETALDIADVVARRVLCARATGTFPRIKRIGGCALVASTRRKNAGLLAGRVLRPPPPARDGTALPQTLTRAVSSR